MGSRTTIVALLAAPPAKRAYAPDAQAAEKLAAGGGAIGSAQGAAGGTR